MKERTSMKEKKPSASGSASGYSANSPKTRRECAAFAPAEGVAFLPEEFPVFYPHAVRNGGKIYSCFPNNEGENHGDLTAGHSFIGRFEAREGDHRKL